MFWIILLIIVIIWSSGFLTCMCILTCGSREDDAMEQEKAEIEYLEHLFRHS